MSNKTSTGHRSTGNWSTGNWSTGDRSTGDCSTGNRSTGDCSTGHCSTGHCSTGNWSISDYSTGHFSTEDYTGFGCFDRPCTLDEWGNAEKPDCLYFDLTSWVSENEMTDEEKKAHPEYKPTGGYLKVCDYREAFTSSMERASKEEIEMVKNLPNFDADKFEQISGFRIKDTVTVTIQGKDIEISVEEFESIKAQFLK